MSFTVALLRYPAPRPDGRHAPVQVCTATVKSSRIEDAIRRGQQMVREAQRIEPAGVFQYRVHGERAVDLKSPSAAIQSSVTLGKF